MKAQKKAIRKENQSLQRITCRCFSQDATYRPSGCQATEVTIVLENEKKQKTKQEILVDTIFNVIRVLFM